MSVMGKSRVSAQQMVAFFKKKTEKHTETGGATVPLKDLAQMFLEEGCDGLVRGDIAFIQAMVETGWLRFSPRMPKGHNNFSGIGAVDDGDTSAKFPNARTGVRAQIQHLRAYADPKATSKNLGHPLVDPRFNLVTPKGKASSWNDFGNGIWASDPLYAGKIKSLYAELLAFDT